MATEIGPIDLGFRTAIRRLDAAGRMIKVLSPIDPQLEAAALMKAERDRALFFPRVGSYSIPLCSNLLVSTANVMTIFGLDVQGIRQCMLRGLRQPIKPRLVKDGPCQEVIHLTSIDLGAILPVLKYSEQDAGRFITAGVVMAKDPATGICNASIHRIQLLGGDRTAIKLDPGRHLRLLYERAEAQDKPLEIAVALGTDLSLMYAAASSGSEVPLDVDEFDVASGIKGSPLEVVKCKTVDLEVPAETEIVIEGEILPQQRVAEGPFIDFMGLPSPQGEEPMVKVKCLSHRRQPIYFAFLAHADTLTKFITEAGLLKAVKAASPIVQDVELTPGSLNRFHLIISVKKLTERDEGLQRNAMLASWAAYKEVDLVVAVDDDIDLRNPHDVEWAIATRFNASKDLLLAPDTKCHPYVPCVENGIRCKMGIDATVPIADRQKYARPKYALTDLEKYQLSKERGTTELHPVFAS